MCAPWLGRHAPCVFDRPCEHPKEHAVTSTDTTETRAAAPNAAAVAEVYAAFGRGDVAAILDQLTEDVAWDV